MEILVKNTTLQQFIKIMILDSMDDKHKFILDEKKDEIVGVIITYISRKIHFHRSNIDYPHQIQKKLKNLCDQVDKSKVMQIDKELIFLNALSFDRIEDYLTQVKELQFLNCVNVERIF